MAVYLLGVALLGSWVIDDAGISFAYARNLAHGHGLVSQPGRPPVEGFSDFLWVLSLVPFFWAKVFHPVFVPKALATLLVLGSIAILQRTMRRHTLREWPGFLASLLVASAAPIVIWTASGLENSLMLLLVVLLWAVAVERGPRWAAATGGLAAFLAMTRPDGLIYALSGPLLIVGELLSRRLPLRRAALDFTWNAGAFLALFAPFLALRLILFGLPFPHTYYAKREYLNHWDHLIAVAHNPAIVAAKAWNLLGAVAIWVGPVAVIGSLVATGALVAKRRLPRTLAAAVVLEFVAVFAYLWLDDDWMGEYRFATAAIALALIVFAAASAALMQWAQSPAVRSPLAAAVALLCGAMAVGGFARTIRFAENPTFPFADVDRLDARRFNELAQRLGVQSGSILLSDVGATLMNSELRVYDTTGLIEPAVVIKLRGWTQYWLPNHPAFYDWVFDEIKPTFISTRVFWTHVTNFEADPRFARDYLAIDAFPDPYIQQRYGLEVHSGDFVRRDALPGPQALDELRLCCRSPLRRGALVHHLADRLRAFGSGDRMPDVAELRERAATAQGKGDWNRAAELLARLLERVDGDLEAEHALATALDKAGRASEARKEWTRTLRLAEQALDEARAMAARDRLRGFMDVAPDAAEAADQRQRMQAALDALHRDGAPARAIPFLHAVVDRQPLHYGGNYHLALALDSVGRSQDARILWTRVLDLAHSFNDAQMVARAAGRLQGADR